MVLAQAAVLFGIGTAGAFGSGLLGIGGAIVLVPMLLYLPPLLGQPAFSMGAVSGMSIVQVLAASLVGMLAHRRAGMMAMEVAVPMGAAIGIGATVGGVASHYTPDRWLQATFALLALAATGLMFLPSRAEEEGHEAPVAFRPWLAAGMAGAIGLVSGLVGAGGSFLLAPLMRSVLHLPLRILIGTSLAIVLVSALGGTLAKAATGQIPWGPSFVLVLGALVGAPAGAWVSRRLHVKTLRWLLAGAIGLTAIKMIVEVWG